MRRFIRNAISIVAVQLCFAAIPGAQIRAADAAPTAADGNDPKTIELVLVPAAEPRPALKYALLPLHSQRQPGNAATYYYRALVLQKSLPNEHRQKQADREEAWLTKDAAAYPREEVEQWLQGEQGVLSQLKVAAYRDYCDWDFRIQDVQGMALISFLMPEIQEARTLARTLRHKAHHEIMAGRYDDALETLRQGYQLARDAGRPPLIIGGLVGIAIGTIMNEELIFLMERTNRNYYWALSGLPQPLVDLRPALEMEMDLPFQIFPFLKDAETAERSPEEWRRLTIECFRDLEALNSSGRPSAGWQNELAAAGMVAKLYPIAKQQLIAEGMSRERVEAMPVGQVVAIQTARATEYAYHEIFKLSLLSFAEGPRRLPAAMSELERKDLVRNQAGLSGQAGIPVASLLLPAMQNVLRALVRAQRDRAALVAIEALRMHAAANAGKLPSALTDVTVVPVPNNPATDAPFPYKLDTSTGAATLELPPVEGLSPRQDSKRYVIKLRN